MLVFINKIINVFLFTFRAVFLINYLNKIPFLFGEGCKVETITLNVEAVNTHRDKPSLNSVSFAATPLALALLQNKSQTLLNT